MDDTKISALTELTSVSSGDWTPIVDTSAATTKKYNTHYIYTGTSGSELQTLLTAANTAGGGIVECPITATITSTTKITIPADVTLRGNPGLTLTSSSDIDMVELVFNARLEGGGMTISNTNGSFSSACVLLDASAANFEFAGNRTLVCDVLLEGPSNEPADGIGLHLYASGSTRAVQACMFRSIVYKNLNVAIREEVVGTGAVAYVNGNVHDGISIDNCTRGLVQTVTGTGTLGTNSNQYKGINVQAGTSMEDALNVVGNSNYFQGRIFDWSVASGTYAVVSTTTNTSGNTFNIPGSQSSEFNTAEHDKIVTAKQTPFNLGGIGVSSLPDATAWKGGMLFLTDVNKLCPAWSTGAVWASLGTVIYNAPTSTELLTDHAKTISQNECGPGVGWSSAGTDAAFDFNLPAANAGMEVILVNSNQVTDCIRSGTNKFADMCGSGASDASIGVSSAQDLRLPAGTAFAHLKCYVSGEWSIIASRGTLSYV